MAFSPAAMLSLSRLQTAPRDVSETVVWPTANPAEALENGDTFMAFSANLKWPLPTKSKCGMKAN